MDAWDNLLSALQERYGDAAERIDGNEVRESRGEPPPIWQNLAQRSSVRSFGPEKPGREELRLLAALALAAPTKSDLQQRDIIIVTDPDKMAALKALFADQAWTAGAPALVIFCANGRRQRLLHEMRGHPFVNDHLDSFFNASVDAAIALAAFVLAAEAAGFGTCPISAIRNEARRASEILSLPEHVFPVAGLAIGKAAEPPEPSLRLPLSMTLHDERYREEDPCSVIDAYDRRRAKIQPYAEPRRADELEAVEVYGWSEDKSRQYSLLERVDFGVFIREKGFKLD
jgi:nitroreductase